jgi:hypothetical protein
VFAVRGVAGPDDGTPKEVMSQSSEREKGTEENTGIAMEGIEARERQKQVPVDTHRRPYICLTVG